MRILGISTSTNRGQDKDSWGSSANVLLVALKALQEQGHEVRCVNAADLHIVPNLSCYANGDTKCGDPESGPYRCWAHWYSVQDPDKYGGVDEMPVLYDNIAWADLVLFATSARWGTHSALLQKIIERMTVLENLSSTYGEPNPLAGKKAGVIVTGHQWLTQRIAMHLLDVFSFMGFKAERGYQFVWQRTFDIHLEQAGPNLPRISDFLDSPAGQGQMVRFLEALVG